LEYLERLIEWKANVNVRFNIGSSTDNTLLHCSVENRDVVPIIRGGFSGMNHENSVGKTPLMAIALSGRSQLLEIYIANGGDIGRQDHLGWNVLHLICNKMSEISYGQHNWWPERRERLFQEMQSTLECAKVVLFNGASTMGGDACRCRCSPSGCLPASFLVYMCMVEVLIRQQVWTLEYLTMLQELRTTQEAKTSLLSMLRIARFNRLELTHVCCRRPDEHGRITKFKPLLEEDAQEIIDEEMVTINELEIQMAELSELPYDSLEELWLQEIRMFAMKCVENAPKPRKPYNVSMEMRKLAVANRVDLLIAQRYLGY
jgi:hypothetical protein